MSFAVPEKLLYNILCSFPVGLITVVRIILHEIFDKSKFPFTHYLTDSRGTVHGNVFSAVCGKGLYPGSADSLSG